MKDGVNPPSEELCYFIVGFLLRKKNIKCISMCQYWNKRHITTKVASTFTMKGTHTKGSKHPYANTKVSD